ncbi:hypothetical protein B0H16DRAFT_1450075 [Mycena metata]|uniref:Uncharacterized protein n=1 Tax=Mycena metata TaxID=1033252 RepID=A0AAD7K050_9AGAR|nr:hypothetical protein B0H16DRAFT_1450075 [Mycena metata]
MSGDSEGSTKQTPIPKSGTKSNGGVRRPGDHSGWSDWAGRGALDEVYEERHRRQRRTRGKPHDADDRKPASPKPRPKEGKNNAGPKKARSNRGTGQRVRYGRRKGATPRGERADDSAGKDRSLRPDGVERAA